MYEVNDLRLKVRAKQNIWSLDVSMDDAPLAAFMQIVQPMGHPNRHFISYSPI